MSPEEPPPGLQEATFQLGNEILLHHSVDHDSDRNEHLLHYYDGSVHGEAHFCRDSFEHSAVCRSIAGEIEVYSTALLHAVEHYRFVVQDLYDKELACCNLQKLAPGVAPLFRLGNRILQGIRGVVGMSTLQEIPPVCEDERFADMGVAFTTACLRELSAVYVADREVLRQVQLLRSRYILLRTNLRQVANSSLRYYSASTGKRHAVALPWISERCANAHR